MKQLTVTLWMTTLQVAETSVTVNCSSIQTIQEEDTNLHN